MALHPASGERRTSDVVFTLLPIPLIVLLPTGLYVPNPFVLAVFCAAGPWRACTGFRRFRATDSWGGKLGFGAIAILWSVVSLGFLVAAIGRLIK